ncbi:hypothetical protein [Pseudoalteromonas umbrosa]|uniref:hypothetical protein n=1 Tax=Pseudoalteromonas umbrosa TaxID=3048489 RepID=UPI0024C45C50|nr:hypothetical protein [Pseudoalteromonas sp. B95]MDK1290065.1 hypothetical protein [Pseudoalteromonas sp. B95]
MALGSQKPTMSLVSGSFGDPDWLRDTLLDTMTAWRNNGKLIIALFAGRRPTREELENNHYLISGYYANYSFIGMVTLDKYGNGNRSAPLLLNPKLKHHRSEGEGLIDEQATPYYNMPNRESELSTDPNDIVNMVFPKGMSYGLHGPTQHYDMEERKLVALNGNDNHRATWGLVCFGTTTSVRSDMIFDNTTAESRRSASTLTREGHNVYINTSRATANYMYYITVGDIEDEPTANLVLRHGAQKGLTRYAYRQIVPSRLRIRMQDLVINPKIKDGL